MPTVVHNKLVRDRIPEIISASGRAPVVHQLKPEEMQPALVMKLLEEVKEFMQAPSVEELADILEVADALSQQLGYSMEHLLAIKQQKREDRGGFSAGHFLERVDD